MNRKMHIKKGDIVVVLAGNDKHMKGKVLEVFPDENRAIVEGVRMIIKHTKPNAKNTQGGRIEQEGKIHASNLNVLCPETQKPTRIGRRLSDKPSKDGKVRLIRYSKKSKSKKEIE